MLHDAMRLADDGPVAIRYPRGGARRSASTRSASGSRARRVRAADGPHGGVPPRRSARCSSPPRRPPTALADRGVDATVWDVRCCAPLDEAMLADAAGHRAVVTVEDGVRDGGIGMTIADRIGAIGRRCRSPCSACRRGSSRTTPTRPPAQPARARRRGSRVGAFPATRHRRRSLAALAAHVDPTDRSRSVLDLSMVSAGMSSTDALAATTELARRPRERLGYSRFWVAEHHNMETVASTSPAVLIAHVAASRRTIHVGSGGVMLPNHAPLVIAEQFAMLEALHPGRIDLGIGRAPGTDPITATALRRTPT